MFNHLKLYAWSIQVGLKTVERIDKKVRIYLCVIDD